MPTREFTFLWIESHSRFLLQHSPQAVIVFLLCGSVHYDMLHHANSPWHSCQHLRHQSLEIFRSRGDTKWQPVKTELLKRSNNVVSNAESGEIRTFQNLELVSNFEKKVAPDNWARTWLTAGSGLHSCQTLSLSLVRSTQIHTFPFGFGTTTMPAHQSVGCSTLVMTPNFSIHSSSCLTGCISGIATLLTTDWETGVLSCMV